ncbi:hypothetical protein L602_001200000830 [Cupriavidus gilardii J11]|uniref:Uncharacterized protein n=1 Tax=Cupriavidus gilardii J11 TaxID=936133 RepID=A0A562BUL5_9BURK|nr:hypothetical protein [Cupriavidus gilardii]TWG88490.1 hypothetical protein L602_001200000830 [Cupriavidus gilardii J11]
MSSYLLRLAAFAAAITTLSFAAPSLVRAAPLAVQVRNLTTPTTCAEEDNVSFALSAPVIQRFRVEALHPPYIGKIRKDSSAPDFSGCNFGDTPHPTDPRHHFEPRKVRLYDGPDLAIVGITFETFWRPQRVPVTVAGRKDDGGFHLLQFFDKRPGKGKGDKVAETEVLVLYPSDGYWRAKPLPAAHLGDNAYGSSFLMGPITQDIRPIVEIADIDIAPQSRTVRLRFEAGGEATVRLAEVSRARTALDVAFTPAYRPAGEGAPFAMLRSMYVAEDNADMSRVDWRDGADRARHANAADTTIVEARTVRFGRVVPSRHNTSAPDIRFGPFEGPSR